MNIENSAVDSALVTVQLTVGASLVTPASIGRKLVRGVTIKADTGNSVAVYVGAVNSGVTATSGFPLLKDETLFVACDDFSRLQFIAASADQKIYLIGL